MNKEIGKCICCNGKLDNLMTLENMPAVAQHMPDIDNIYMDEPVNLNLCQCNNCGLVQFDVEPVWYYKDVIRAGGGTTTMKKLRKDEYERFLNLLNNEGYENLKIVEIGCGKGEFLEMWKDVSCDTMLEVIGIENDSNLVNNALEKGLKVFEGFAEKDYIIPDGPYDAFVQFNFLEHQPDPVGMLRTIRENLTENGYGLLTVPSFEYIQQYDGYYELMRDHIAYYTVESLNYVINMAGFEQVSNRIINRDTIEMIIKVSENKQELLNNNTKTDASSLMANYTQMKKDIDDIDSISMAVWGASHQAFTLAATTNLNKKVKYIIDSAEFKHGKYSPASHIKIVSPDYFFVDPVKEILIVAPGYTDEIANIIKDKYGEDVKILMLKEQRVVDYE